MLVHGYDGASPPKISGPERPFPVLLFGPFRLDIGGRLLERNGMPVNVGARAFDILVALALRAGHTVCHDELMTLVWPNVTVTPVSLRGNIATLRKALGDKRCGARYIINNTGRGYCFVAPVAYAETRETAGSPTSYPSLGHNNAPSDRATEATGRSRSYGLRAWHPSQRHPDIIARRPSAGLPADGTKIHM
jgi:DNA-binding winged helix-turn-helix (wHTH) protein